MTDIVQFIFEAFTKPNLQRSVVDDVVVSTTLMVLLVVAFIFYATALWLHMWASKGRRK